MIFKGLTLIGSAMALAIAPAPASARFYYCTVSIGGQQAASGKWPVAQSGIVDQDQAAFGGALEKDFYSHIRPQYRETFSDGCQSFDTLEEADKSMKLRKDQSPGDVLTGWTGRFRPANTGAARAEPSSGGAFVSVKESGLAATIDAWENTVLQAHRESAAFQAKTIALTAASRAEYDRLFAKVKAEMKKRGNKQ